MFYSSAVDEDLNNVSVVADENKLLHDVLLALVAEQLAHAVPKSGSAIK